MNQTKLLLWGLPTTVVATVAGAAVVFFAFALMVGATHAQTTTYPTPSPAPTTPTPSIVPTVAPTPTPTTTTATASSSGTVSTPTASSLPPMIVSVDSAGNILLRGTVVTTGANSLTLNSWGGTWTVQTTGTGQVIPGASAVGDMSGIRAGDFVGVEGTLGSGSWTVAASVVHDWTQSPSTTGGVSTDTSVNASTTTGVAATLPTGTSMLPAGDTLYTGTASDVSNIGSNSFVLTDASGTTYTVTVAPDATLWNTASTDIPLSSIAQGDSIRLDGSVTTSGNLTADVVRDTSQ